MVATEIIYKNINHVVEHQGTWANIKQYWKIKLETFGRMCDIAVKCVVRHQSDDK